jgi:excisionase family DNA binding protein
MPVESPFLTLRELATYLNESPSTIRTWVAQRRIPHYKRGRRLQFNIDEIKEWDRENNYRAPLSEREQDALKIKNYV